MFARLTNAKGLWWRYFRPILNLLNNFKAVAEFASSSRIRQNSVALALLSFISSTVYADVCVWRNPERTMIKIFPEAGDYKTITKIIINEKREVIEKRLGEKLAPGEREDWIYYEITGKKGETVGYISADAEKGEYGVIEIVMGITPDGKVNGIYIQRSRERDKEFDSKEFLEQFIGKTVKDPIGLLFSIELAFQSELNNEDISEDLRREFKNNRLSLSFNATISIEKKGGRWLITDTDNKQTYYIVKEKGKLNIYQIGSDVKPALERSEGIPGKSIAVNAVILGVKKMLIFYDELGRVITKLQDILKNPAHYKDREVVLEGNYGGVCCPTDFFYKEGSEVIEIRGSPPSKTEKGKQIRVYAVVRVVDKRVLIEAKAVEVNGIRNSE